MNARPTARYHLGFHEPITKSTLADANELRDSQLWQDLAKTLIRIVRPLYAGKDLGLEIDNMVCSLDSITIDLSLMLSPWADCRKTKAGIKRHTQVDLRGPIPTSIFVSVARQLDVLWLAIIHKELNLPGTLHRTLQLLNVHPFEKVPIHDLIAESVFRHLEELFSSQVMMCNL